MNREEERDLPPLPTRPLAQHLHFKLRDDTDVTTSITMTSNDGDPILADVMNHVSPSLDPPQKVLAKMIEDNPDPGPKAIDYVKYGGLAAGAAVGMLPVVGNVMGKIATVGVTAYKEKLETDRLAANTIRFTANQLTKLAGDNFTASPLQLDALENYKSLRLLTAEAGSLKEKLSKTLEKAEKVFQLGQQIRDVQAAAVEEVRADLQASLSEIESLQEDMKKLNDLIQTVAGNSRRLDEHGEVIAGLQETVQGQEQRLAVVEQQMAIVMEKLAEMKAAKNDTSYCQGIMEQIQNAFAYASDFVSSYAFVEADNVNPSGTVQNETEQHETEQNEDVFHDAEESLNA
ncbi:hypothetical protein BDR26DRAFT_938500 [Obelidium mucronatum]|nr:hypothetical protein BDR26DRAFT_938500 [Obelidium mucronatum]